jgi:hypothetical protein
VSEFYQRFLKVTINGWYRRYAQLLVLAQVLDTAASCSVVEFMIDADRKWAKTCASDGTTNDWIRVHQNGVFGWITTNSSTIPEPLVAHFPAKACMGTHQPAPVDGEQWPSLGLSLWCLLVRIIKSTIQNRSDYGDRDIGMESSRRSIQVSDTRPTMAYGRRRHTQPPIAEEREIVNLNGVSIYPNPCLTSLAESYHIPFCDKIYYDTSSKKDNPCAPGPAPVLSGMT